MQIMMNELERQLDALVGSEIRDVSLDTIDNLISSYRAGNLNCPIKFTPYSDSFIICGILVLDHIPVITVSVSGSVLTVVQGAEIFSALFDYINNDSVLSGLSYEYACLNGCYFSDLPEKYQKKLLFSPVLLKEMG